MESKKILPKRRLPGWMETVHSQNKKVANSESSKLQDDGRGLVEKIEENGEKLPFEATSEKQVNAVENVTSEPDRNNSKMVQEKSFPLSGKSYDSSPNLSAAQVIAQSMPELVFKGRVIYSCHHADCACLCQDILSTLHSSSKTPVGFDTEWLVTFQRGSSNKTALIQMCLSEDVCYLFHVSAMMKFPEPLKNLLSDERLLLVGLNIESDFWKLERDFDLKVKPIIDKLSLIDVGKLANQKLKSLEQWTLDGLCRNVLRQRLNKGPEVRLGNWCDVPLSKQQKLYAATDALAGLLLYSRLNEKMSWQTL